MNTNETETYEQAVAVREAAASALFRAEVALHDAHETRVDRWISAAADRLHDAVLTYEAAREVVAGYALAA